MPARLLPIYLNDHVLGATVGRELVRRAQRENAGSELGDFLARLAGEIEEDYATLERVLERLGVAPSALKRSLGWTAEKLGRLKLNGQVSGYSPLSRLFELEGLGSGIEGKRSLWVTLGSIREREPRLAEFDFEALEARARDQLEALEPHRRDAARAAF